MMSSLASVLVANAKATPEMVVPYKSAISALVPCYCCLAGSYKVYANNQLRFTPACTFHLDR